MAKPNRDKTLNTHGWLNEAGADEAVADAPVNRFAALASPPHTASPAELRPQSINKRPEPASAVQVPPNPVSPIPNMARALAQSCNTLAE